VWPDDGPVWPDDGPVWPDDGPRDGGRRLATAQGVAGELALVTRDGHLELIGDGVFLLDTRTDGRSERLLVDASLDLAGRPTRRVLLGGLGFGYSLAAALDREVDEVVVVEREPAVVAWNRTITGRRSGGSVDAAGVRCVVADLVTWVADTARTREPPFDAICLDVDNGPGWLVSGSNRWLYDDEGTAVLHDRLRDGGVLGVWSATADDGYRDRLSGRFGDVEVREAAVARGGPDVVFLARR
jgi:spermidine synthase